MRNINIQTGNYSKNVSGDYIESKSIVTETVFKDGKVITTRTITTTAADDSTEPIYKAESVSSNDGFSIGDMFGSIANTLSNIKQAATTKSMIIGDKTTGNLHIDDIVERDEYLDNLERSAIDRAREFKDVAKETIINSESNKESQDDIVEDFWLTEDHSMLDPRLSVFFEVFYDQLEIVLDNPIPHEYIKAVIEMIEYFELAPAIMQYVLDNQEAVIEAIEEGDDIKVALKLFKKLIVSLDV